jgi:IS30 family transposase
MDRRSYGQLNLTERIEIYRLHEDGKSVRFIARALGRSPSTISRELRRNGKRSGHGWRGGYDPQRAEALTKRRHARGRAHKLVRQPELRKLVFDQLAMDRSPEQIAGRLALEQGKTVISHESIYRYIYWRVWSFNENLHRLLPRKKYKRGRYGKKGGSSKNLIERRASVHRRPQDVDTRQRDGHWEADLIQFSKPGQVLVVHERKSRFTALLPQDTKTANDVARNLRAFFRRLPRKKRKSVTFDNGSEFSRHHELIDHHGMKTWFCDTHSPWQKGGVENAIGRVRRRLPRKTDPASLTAKKLATLTSLANNTPRKCLGFRTPAEVFFNKKPSVALLM